MQTLTRALSLILLYALCFSASAGETLWITLGDSPSAGRSYGSKPDTRITAAAGSEVVLQRASGRDYAIEAGVGGWSWFQVQQVPARESYVALTPTLEGDNVSVAIKIAERNGDTFNAIETTVGGKLGEWIVLVDNAAGATTAGSKVYGSKRPGQSLAIRVEKAR